MNATGTKKSYFLKLKLFDSLLLSLLLLGFSFVCMAIMSLIVELKSDAFAAPKWDTVKMRHFSQTRGHSKMTT